MACLHLSIAVNVVKAIDLYFHEKEEPVKSFMLALRSVILRFDPHITEQWKYGMPFYCYNNKMFCYLWIHKKYKQPYIGIVEGSGVDHPLLIQEKRARMKIMLLDPTKDVPVKTISTILKEARKSYAL
ncbi:DUF1801 domain-containing protein [Ohtaekwangia kribbensis]|uniref:DUF1801 domain-containing protein n=1 Tax=Ohtaekwangia kribbensis TaxID=688913 RepID=A0ABW3JY32_9BACT